MKPRAGGESQVSAPFAGRIVAESGSIPRLGGSVRKGDLLAEVEQIFPASERLQVKTASLQLETEINQARQELDLRQRELDRARQLYDGGAIPQKQLQTAEFNIQQAQAKLDGAGRAKAEYDAAISQQSEQRRTAIHAPISGTVAAIDLVSGQQVDPSKSLMIIVDASTVWVELAVSERDLPQARRAADAEIIVPSNPNRIYHARLVNIGAVVDPQNRTVPFTFSVSNDGGLKLEMYVEGGIPTGAPRHAIVIPASALLLEEGVSSVFVETGPGVFRRRIVIPGRRRGEKLVISGGLQAGEKVVSRGAQALNSETLKGLIPVLEEGERR
ncbi:MAG: hypothetical protein DMG13_28120 [Acidobacteria bacterium]|nr:MAG: hypothetical protein DMG13_28120 [Acidobacteriota bacterium]